MIFTGRNIVQAFCDSEKSNIRAITLEINSAKHYLKQKPVSKYVIQRIWTSLQQSNVRDDPLFLAVQIDPTQTNYI